MGLLFLLQWSQRDTTGRHTRVVGGLCVDYVGSWCVTSTINTSLLGVWYDLGSSRVATAVEAVTTTTQKQPTNLFDVRVGVSCVFDDVLMDGQRYLPLAAAVCCVFGSACSWSFFTTEYYSIFPLCSPEVSIGVFVICLSASFLHPDCQIKAFLECMTPTDYRTISWRRLVHFVWLSNHFLTQVNPFLSSLWSTRWSRFLQQIIKRFLDLNYEYLSQQIFISHLSP